jgi:FemAB-related protein (PEP-CTERM system-associated)
MTVTPTITATVKRGRAREHTATLTIEPALDSRADALWYAYVARHANATIFHEPTWCRAVEHVFGHRGHHLLARRDGDVVGVLPLVEVRSLLAGRLLVSVPYGTYGGILADDAATCQALADEAIRLTQTSGARLLDLRSAEALVPGLERVEQYDTYVRELPPHPDELENYLPRRARAAARQARQREGADIRHDHQHLAAVWHLYTRSMRRLGSINYPYALFAELFAQFGQRAWLTTLWRAEQLIGGVISLVHRDTVMPYVIGLDERVRCYGGSNLLYFAIMERAVRTGLRRFDFGRSRRANSGSAGFKKNQGFEPRQLGYQRYVPPGLPAPDLTPTNRRFSLVRRVWPRLPLCATRWLGGWLAKSIPG